MKDWFSANPGVIRLSMPAVPELTPEQVEAKRAAMRDKMERVALTLELIDARRRLLGEKIDKTWEDKVISEAIGDLDPSPALSLSGVWANLFGGSAE